MSAETLTEPGVAARFMAKVDASGGPAACHEWTANRTPHGYGQLKVAGRLVYAHRWILGYVRGSQLTASELALHHCDNPPCVNPAHLYVGDQKRNMADCRERGRLNTAGLAYGRLPGKTLGKYRTGNEICGSVRGYNRHLRHGEPSCQPCRDAINEYHRARRMP